ncbi:reverse transcriptase-like protein [Elysia marginata]|uniref:Reverse transcriptase-like protein n=1 Tax=Elysia marginata TaxID=1093978 RepID=A0AAV4I1B6_9GAST|nr:reverse transcriptase-like protein [Elysia marginata]
MFNQLLVNYIGCLSKNVLFCFKIAITVFKCLNGIGPQYLSELLNSYVPNRSLRSMNENLLGIPTTNLKLGERATPESHQQWLPLRNLSRQSCSRDP